MNVSKKELEHQLIVLMGGRAAEHIVFDEISTGAADDLAKVTDIARRMVTRFGMAGDIGQVVYEEERQAFMGEAFGAFQSKEYSEETAREIDVAVRALVDKAFERAVQVLNQRRADLDAGAALLLEKETITADEFPPISGKVPAGQTAREETPKVDTDGTLRVD